MYQDILKQIRQSDENAVLNREFPGKSCGNKTCEELCSRVCKIAKMTGVDPAPLIDDAIRREIAPEYKCLPGGASGQNLCRFGFQLRQTLPLSSEDKTVILGRIFKVSGNKECEKCKSRDGRFIPEEEYKNSERMKKLGFYLQEDGIMRPHPNCKCKWNPVLLRDHAKCFHFIFNGITFSCRDRGLSLEAVSGTPVKRTKDSLNPISGEVQKETEYYFDYSVARQKFPYEGPTPEGKYMIISQKIRSKWGSPFSHIIKNKGWGNYALELFPLSGTETYGRTGMFIHGGWEWGSAGCIDLTSGDTAFRNFLEANEADYGYVYVQYPQKMVVKKNLTPQN